MKVVENLGLPRARGEQEVSRASLHAQRRNLLRFSKRLKQLEHKSSSCRQESSRGHVGYEIRRIAVEKMVVRVHIGSLIWHRCCGGNSDEDLKVI